MYLNDPISVRQIRNAQLLEADQARNHRGKRPRRHRARRSPVRRDRLRRWPLAGPPQLDPTLELFEGVDRRTLRRLERHVEIVEATGGSLGRQGDPATEFVVILDGRVGVTIDGLPIAVLDRGSHFGAIPLLDGEPGRFSLAAFDVLEPSRLAVADRDGFLRMLAESAIVDQRVRHVAAVRRAYLAGHADARALAADRDHHPFPVHVGS